MLSGMPLTRKAENGFKAERINRRDKLALEWLEQTAKATGENIKHQCNSGEFRVGPKQLPVDGYCEKTRTVYQFDGCLFHGHECDRTKGLITNPVNNVEMAELRKRTLENTKYIQDLGYTLVRITECVWLDMRKKSLEITQFTKTLDYPTEQLKCMSEKQILNAILDNKMFGLVYCDIMTPEHLKSRFEEMPPIFKNVDVSQDDIGDFMQKFAIDHNLLKQPRRSLISSYFGTNILLTTPLVKYYIKLGLQVTKIHQVIEYSPSRCFMPFVNAVSNA